jgi:hypothetical protein
MWQWLGVYLVVTTGAGVLLVFEGWRPGMLLDILHIQGGSTGQQGRLGTPAYSYLSKALPYPWGAELPEAPGPQGPLCPHIKTIRSSGLGGARQVTSFIISS